MRSSWPIATLRALRRAPPAEATALDDIVAHQGETVWIWRHGWQSRCRPLTPPEIHWLAILGETPSLDAALDSASACFDFAAWLREAVEAGWIDGVDSDDADARVGDGRVSSQNLDAPNGRG